MDACCLQSFVEKGFRDGFRLSREGDTHTCETCQRRYELRADPELSTATRRALTWREITH